MSWQVIGKTRDRLGESPLWHPGEQALYWIDFYGPTIHRLEPGSGTYRRWMLAAAPTIGSLAFCRNGRLLLALENGLYHLDTATDDLWIVGDPESGRAGIGYNDAKVDRDGRYWVGTWDMAERSPRGILHRMQSDGRTAIADSGYVVCNGPAFSPAGDILYFSDSAGCRLLAYPLDRLTGLLSAPRILAEFRDGDGMPDGLCVDSDGALYCAHYGGGRVSRFSPDGGILEALELPVRNVTACCLGGPDLNILYVTTAENGGASPLDGGLFARKVRVPGLPEPLFTSFPGLD